MRETTILLVDADSETEEKIVSILEARNYLVFTALSREVSAEMADRLSPSLIFLKPTALSVEGFQACKAIHNMEAFKNVPIVLLASLKEPMDARYTTFYGIMDFLKMPLNPEAVIEKTEKILGVRPRDIKAPEKEFGLSEEYATQEELLRLQEEPASDSVPVIGSPELLAADDSEPAEETVAPLEEKTGLRDEFAAVTEDDEVSEIGQPNEDYTYAEENDSLRENLVSTATRKRPRQRGLLIPVIIAVSAIVIVAAGYLSYKFFVAEPEIKVSAPVRLPGAVQKQEPSVPPPQGQQQQGEPLAEPKPEVTKEVPEETLAAASKGKPAGKPVYSVQIGAFRSEGVADALAKSYEGKGYEAFTQKGATKDNATVYRVLIGQYENRKEAQRLAGKIKTQEKIDTIVIAEKTQ
jgi:cell division septation protein DedD/FixJ family two-component response regulator